MHRLWWFPGGAQRCSEAWQAASDARKWLYDYFDLRRAPGFNYYAEALRLSLQFREGDLKRGTIERIRATVKVAAHAREVIEKIEALVTDAGLLGRLSRLHFTLGSWPSLEECRRADPALLLNQHGWQDWLRYVLLKADFYAEYGIRMSDAEWAAIVEACFGASVTAQRIQQVRTGN